MARKIFMNKHVAYSFAKAVSGTVEKEPVNSIWQNHRPTGYVVFYDPENLTAVRSILHKEPQEVNWDLFMLHTGKISYDVPSYGEGLDKYIQ